MADSRRNIPTVQPLRVSLTPAGEALRPVVALLGDGETVGSPTTLAPTASIRRCSCGTCDAVSTRPGSRRRRRSSTSASVVRHRETLVVVVDGEEVDLCSTDPGFDVDLTVWPASRR
jgi:hypothetical protein